MEFFKDVVRGDVGKAFDNVGKDIKEVADDVGDVIREDVDLGTAGMVTGAVLGSVIPGAGTVAGAALGASLGGFTDKVVTTKGDIEVKDVLEVTVDTAGAYLGAPGTVALGKSFVRAVEDGEIKSEEVIGIAGQYVGGEQYGQVLNSVTQAVAKGELTPEQALNIASQSIGGEQYGQVLNSVTQAVAKGELTPEQALNIASQQAGHPILQVEGAANITESVSVDPLELGSFSSGRWLDVSAETLEGSGNIISSLVDQPLSKSYLEENTTNCFDYLNQREDVSFEEPSLDDFNIDSFETPFFDEGCC